MATCDVCGGAGQCHHRFHTRPLFEKTVEGPWEGLFGMTCPPCGSENTEDPTCPACGGRGEVQQRLIGLSPASGKT
jgi:hypothetical protein